MFTTRRTSLTLVLLVLLMVAPAAQPLARRPHDISSTLPHGGSQSTATSIDTFFTRLVSAHLFSGAVLISWHGHFVLSKGYGWAGVDAHVPNTANTAFRIGSITKQFTALAILLLQHQGKLHVQNHICRYVVPCPTTWHAITIQELLTHTSGIPSYTAFPDYADWKSRPVTPAQLMAHFKDKPLDFTPGTRYRYSNSGYALLGYIITKVSGEAYATFLQRHIFAPLHLSQTGYGHNHPPLPGHARGYASWDSPADFIDMSVPYAAGGLYSTVENLDRWDHALLSGTGVPKAVAQTMFTPYVTVCKGTCGPFSRVSYGYGWFVGQEPHRRVIEHTGGIDGFVALNRLYPDDNATVIVLSNLQTATLNVISAEIERRLFSKG